MHGIPHRLLLLILVLALAGIASCDRSDGWPDAPLGPVHPADPAADEVTRRDAEVLSVVLADFRALTEEEGSRLWHLRPREGKDVIFIDSHWLSPFRADRPLIRDSTLENLFRSNGNDSPGSGWAAHRSLEARNGESGPIGDVRFDQPFGVVALDEILDDSILALYHVPAPGHAWLMLGRPGYARDRGHALVTFKFRPAGTFPPQATAYYWLRRGEEGWEIVWREFLAVLGTPALD